MKLTPETRTYDGTGRAGYCPCDPAIIRATTPQGIASAWKRIATAELARKIKFQEDYRATVEKFDAIVVNGFWIMEAYATDSRRRRYRFIAAAERGSLIFCGAFDTRDQFPAYRDMCDRIGAIKDKYRAPVA